jgi:hypothetical protein
MKGYYKQLVMLLAAHGFGLLRQGKGSHEIWTNGSLTVSVPYPCKSRFTANAVLKAAGIAAHL